MTRLHSCIHPSIHQHPSRFHRKKRQPKFSWNFSLHQKSPVLTSSPNIQGKKQDAKAMKHNFKEMVDKQNSSNSEKNDSSDCCKECKDYYYVRKKECGWRKCSVCERWLHENCKIFSKTHIDFGCNNCSKCPEKRKKSTKKHEKVSQWYRI